MVMAPLMLAALQRKLESTSQPLIGVPLLENLQDDWRATEETDAAIVALRMQLYRQVFEWKSILLQQLHPGFCSTGCDVRVLLPTGGYSIRRHEGKRMNLADFRKTVAEATKSGGWMHLGPGNSGPADSWLVLSECDEVETLTGRKVVLHIQSKSSSSTGNSSTGSRSSRTFNMQLLEAEVQKVQPLGGDTLQALLFVSDNSPGQALKRRLEQPDAVPQRRSPREQRRKGVQWTVHSARSATAAHQNGSIAVVIVAGQEQQSLRGAADLVRRAKKRIQ